MQNDWQQQPQPQQQPQLAPSAAAREQVMIPAILIMAVAGLGFFMAFLTIGLQTLGMGASMFSGVSEEEVIGQLVGGSVQIGMSIVSILFYAVAFFGAYKMKNLQSYGLACVAALLVAVPCISPCCVLGLPVGIWALVVLMSEEVKRSFS